METAKIYNQHVITAKRKNIEIRNLLLKLINLQWLLFSKLKTIHINSLQKNILPH